MQMRQLFSSVRELDSIPKLFQLKTLLLAKRVHVLMIVPEILRDNLLKY